MSRVAPLVEAPIAAHHDRKTFDCGDTDLNGYLQHYARQNHERGGAKCFVAVDPQAPDHILGFYTLSPASLHYARTPEIVRRGLGRYEVHVFRLGRLAVDLRSQGTGLGGKFLLAAGERTLIVSEQVGGVALLIDAKDDRARVWYQSYGAISLADAELSLVLPLKTIAATLAVVTS